jgi:hypothetical protein
MPRLEWDLLRNRTYEVGVDRGVLYLSPKSVFAWPGLVSVTEIHAEQEVTPEYFDGVKKRTALSKSHYSAKISAFAAPKEFFPCEGILRLGRGFYVSNQPYQTFGFSYRTLIGNSIEGLDYGYKIHIVYNAIVAPGSVTHRTFSADTDITELSWTINAIPYQKRELVWFNSTEKHKMNRQRVAYFPTSHLVISSRTVNPKALGLLEDVLYGSPATDPVLPGPAEIVEILR